MLRVAFVTALLCACNGSTGDNADASSNDAADASTADDPDASPTGGCGAAGAATGAIDDSITVRGEDRSYILAVPSSYDSDTHYALVFAWHGLGSNASQARYYFGVEEASAGAAIVVYPNGLPKYGTGTQTGWDLDADGEDVELFDALLARLSADYCIDSARVFSTGHSFGGYMSNILGCARAGAVRGIAPVAGGGPYGFCVTDRVAAWIAHGIHDTSVALSEGEGSRDHWRAHNGCQTTTSPIAPSPCVAFDGCADGYPVHWCAHEETALSGHGWPTFAPAGIWGFFAALE